MARPASGKEVLAKAQEVVANARTVEELRQAQSVILPLKFGFSMEEVASVTGISKGWACQLRTRFIRSGGKSSVAERKRGGRRRENMDKEEEAAFLAPFFDKAAQGGILVAGEIKRALDDHLGRKVPLSSVYNLLHRHNWRKLAPDKRHPKADAAAQAEWKKNSRHSSP
jgi:transposase